MIPVPDWAEDPEDAYGKNLEILEEAALDELAQPVFKNDSERALYHMAQSCVRLGILTNNRELAETVAHHEGSMFASTIDGSKPCATANKEWFDLIWDAIPGEEPWDVGQNPIRRQVSLSDRIDKYLHLLK